MSAVTFEPLAPWHLDIIAETALGVDARQRWLEPDNRRMVAAWINPETFHAGFYQGQLIGVAGVIEHWPGRGEAVLVQAEGMPHVAWGPVTRHAHQLLARAHATGMIRIETTVRAEFLAGHRWARRLGFELRCYDKRYFSDGSDAVQYVRLAPARETR